MSKRQHPRIGHEVAEASRIDSRAVIQGVKRRGHPSSLIASARQLERYLLKRRQLRRQLKAVEEQIKHEKKMLRAMAGAEEEL